MKYEIKNVKTLDQIEALASQSAFTFEGMSTEKENLEAIVNWLKSKEATKENETITFHLIAGKLMNECYSLTGDNAYPGDLTIMSLTGINTFKLALARFEVGGRWLDDIIDNNLEREAV